MFNIDICVSVVGGDALLFRFAMDILFRLVCLFVVVRVVAFVLVCVLIICCLFSRLLY